ncbi:MAG: hypothetical protein MUF01_07380 [Bryobacterales bacterium]|jgi:hypothetical protein|nr:hypothetical protein [Bryobacterales bacterium]
MYIFILIFLLFAPWFAVAQHQIPSPIDPDEGTFASSRLKIPEPMVFDLVRPLGALKGELEVNSLFKISEFGGHPVLQWAPEIEYTFADGWGIEFELPAENSILEAYKLAIQGKFKRLSTRSTLQGWQGIYEWDRINGSPQLDLLHLFGWQIHSDWSFFSMNGVRRFAAPRRDFGYLGNHTVFRRFSSRFELGLETNTQATPSAPVRFMAMPQILWRVGHYNIQAGVGTLSEVTTRPKVAWRVSREF